jgi:hypothetical protein
MFSADCTGVQHFFTAQISQIVPKKVMVYFLVY